MNKLHDPELERFKRTVDLADYAKRAGYEPRPQDGAPGLTVLDHQNSDRIVVGKHPNGQWVYASVPDYVLRSPGEPANEALSRLRSAIGRSQDKGTIVEFIQQRDPRTLERVVPLETVRARLRSFGLSGCRSTSRVPSLRRRIRAVASGPSNRAASAARGRIGRTQIGTQSPSLRLEPARRERAAGDRSGAPAPGVA